MWLFFFAWKCPPMRSRTKNRRKLHVQLLISTNHWLLEHNKRWRFYHSQRQTENPRDFSLSQSLKTRKASDSRQARKTFSSKLNFLRKARWEQFDRFSVILAHFARNSPQPLSSCSRLLSLCMVKFKRKKKTLAQCFTKTSDKIASALLWRSTKKFLWEITFRSAI